MSYLVMECHPGYAVVLDETGRFLKVANMRYEVGQRVSDVTGMRTGGPGPGEKRKARRRLRMFAVAAAACLCLVAGGAWRLFMTPYGTVRMQINPDVRMSVNRMDYVIGIEGLNADGVDLIASYQYTRKKVNEVSDELAERAARMGYLKEDGAIWITVDSDHEEWRVATEERLIIALEVHVGASVTVTSGALEASGSSDHEAFVPVQSPQPPYPAIPDDDADDDAGEDMDDGDNNVDDDADDDWDDAFYDGVEDDLDSDSNGDVDDGFGGDFDDDLHDDTDDDRDDDRDDDFDGE